MTSVEELDALPGMAGLYARALTGALPVIGARGQELPDTELRVGGVVADRDRVAAYDRVCGFRLHDRVPATYLHVLSFPLQLRLMTARGFPFGVLGLVHVANRIEQLRPVRLGDELSLRARAQGLRPHARGRQFDVIAEAAIGAATVWRGTSTYLRREAGGAERPRSERDRERPGEGMPPAASQARWTIPADAGRRYAAVSGDRNPIHLHPLGARALGLERPIAHGMWLLARCVAALEGMLPDAVAIEVRFKRPLALPATATFASWPHRGGHGFAVRSADGARPHLDGEAVPISGSA